MTKEYTLETANEWLVDQLKAFDGSDESACTLVYSDTGEKSTVLLEWQGTTDEGWHIIALQTCDNTEGDDDGIVDYEDIASWEIEPGDSDLRELVALYVEHNGDLSDFDGGQYW